jgi:hypothetical protein
VRCIFQVLRPYREHGRTNFIQRYGRTTIVIFYYGLIKPDLILKTDDDDDDDDDDDEGGEGADPKKYA